MSPGAYGIRQSVLNQSPITSPKKCRRESKQFKSPSKTIGLSNGRNLEIVSDSSNDAFTFLCSHPEARNNVDLPIKNTVLGTKANTSVKVSKTSSIPTSTSNSSQSAPTTIPSILPSIFDTPLTDSSISPNISHNPSESTIPTDQSTSAHNNQVSPDNRELPQTQLLRCGDFVISDYIIITSSLSTSNMDRIRAFASRASILWMQDFPHETSLVDASNPVEPPPNLTVPVPQQQTRGKNRRKRAQRFILVIRAKDGWCKRTVKYLYGLA